MCQSDGNNIKADVKSVILARASESAPRIPPKNEPVEE